MRADPGFLARTDRTGALAARRRRRRARAASSATCWSPRGPWRSRRWRCPRSIGEHLGIVDPVTADGADRDGTVGARCAPRGTALVLTAVCAHPAVEVALRAHVDALNQVLTEVQRAASADATLAAAAPRADPRHHRRARARPRSTASGPTSRPGSGSGWPRTGCRNCSWASSCTATRRSRSASCTRTRWTRAATARPAPSTCAGPASSTTAWAGRISFAQGTDEDGRPYLDCVDNGIGMGVRELSEVFSQAGVRLGDLPEFLEEQAEWARLDPPVQLFPNSRFGIGVLSYFMLADEITVDTCRLGRDGQPGQRLRVSIAGPGSLFRIQHPRPGYRVGHHHPAAPARPPRCPVWTHCAAVLWVADFHTEAEHGTERQVWLPGRALRGGRPEPRRAEERDRRRPWWPTRPPACGGATARAAILADGLWAGQELSGAVVNLSRELAPRLSVDRTKILAYREEDLERLLWQAVPALVDAGPVVLTFGWLYTFAFFRPLIADVIFERALATGYLRWDLGGDTVDATIAGCFGPDGGTLIGPDQLIEWRLTALAAAGRHGKLITPGAGLGPGGPGPAVGRAAAQRRHRRLGPVAGPGRARAAGPSGPGRPADRAQRQRDRRPAGGARLLDRGRARDRRRRPGRPGPAQPRPGRVPAVAGPGRPGRPAAPAQGGPAHRPAGAATWSPG